MTGINRAYISNDVGDSENDMEPKLKMRLDLGIGATGKPKFIKVFCEETEQDLYFNPNVKLAYNGKWGNPLEKDWMEFDNTNTIRDHYVPDERVDERGRFIDIEFAHLYGLQTTKIYLIILWG